MATHHKLSLFFQIRYPIHTTALFLQIRYIIVGASFVKHLAGQGWSSELVLSLSLSLFPFLFLFLFLFFSFSLSLSLSLFLSFSFSFSPSPFECSLTKGWSTFAQEAGLEHQETLVFTFIGESVFHVSVYDSTGCKKLPSHVEEDEGALSRAIIPIPLAIPVTPENWIFSKEVKDHHFNVRRMDIPKLFVLSTGIATRMALSFLGLKGKSWPITITDRGGRQEYNMSSGILDFLYAKEVLVGDKISFEFIGGPDNTILALVTHGQSRRPAQPGRRD